MYPLFDESVTGWSHFVAPRKRVPNVGIPGILQLITILKTPVVLVISQLIATKKARRLLAAFEKG